VQSRLTPRSAWNQEKANDPVCLRISVQPSQIILSATKVMIPNPTQEIQ
jgi:hypothetical protein